MELMEVLYSLRSQMLPTEQTKRGAGWVGYRGGHSEAEIKFTWSKAMTYEECYEAIKSLYTHLTHDVNMNMHPIRAEISKTDVSGVLVTVEINFIKGQSMTIDVDSDYEFKGLFYPDRTMPTDALQGILKQMKDDANSQIPTQVPIPWHKSYRIKNLSSLVSVVLVWPKVIVPFTNVANLIKAVEAFYSAPGAKQGPLVGEFRLKKLGIMVGYFNVLIKSDNIRRFRTLEDSSTENLAKG